MNVFRPLVLLTSTLLLFATAFAQNDTVPEIEMQEIVVGASKNQTKYRDLAASASVVGGSTLQAGQIRTLSDMSAFVPNFFMHEYGSKLTSPVYIRGIGSRINSPSVGLYVDGVPYFEKSAFAFDFFDIQQIEVLRGPQGTLFGRNTIAGIVNITTLSPMDFRGLRITATAANFGNYAGNVGYYGKIGKNFAYSVGANYMHNDGFYNNTLLGQAVDKTDAYGFRNRLIGKFGKFSIENIISADRSLQGGYPYAVLDSTKMFTSEINYNQPSTYNRDMLSDAFIAKFATEKFEVSSTTSYQYMLDKQSIDQDFSADSTYFVVQNQKQNMISEELILRSKNTKYYEWLVGGYAFQQTLDKSVEVNTYKIKNVSTKDYTNIVWGYAAFHQSTFKYANFKLTAGVRIDFENDSLHYKFINIKKGAETVNVDTVYPLRAYSKVVPKIAVSYAINKSSIYASVADGYKTGGYNATFERPEDLTYEPEYSKNYELGFKSTFMGGKMHTDVAVFYINWLNQQITQAVIPSGRGTMQKNAGISESKGFELSVIHKPTKGFSISGSYGYTEAKFVTYHDSILNNVTKEYAHINYDGNYIPLVPRHTVSGQVSYSYNCKFKALDKIRIGIGYKGNGDLYWNDDNVTMQKYYNLLDAKLSFIKKGLQLDFWGKNLTNETYHAYYFKASGKNYVQVGKPLQFGANLSITL